jgi:hypothetical protein
MVYKPRTEESIYESLRDGLTSRIAKLTNFVQTSFNYVWTQTFSSRFRDNEVALLATQLSGWVEYAGGPITQEDLDSLGVNDVSPEEVNEFVSDEDLDNLVEIVGVERDPGQKARGEVTFTTVSSFTEIPAGTAVGTQPGSDGDFFEYTTDEEVTTASGVTEVVANVSSVEVGQEFNVGSGRVTYLPSPPTGVQSVVNNDAILGGVDEESNEDLRNRAKNAIFNKSGGGTASGVEGFVASNTKNVSTVEVAEYPGGNASLALDTPSPGGPGGSSSTAPFADVIVEGGDNSDILDSIQESRPVAIQHNLVRPILVEVNINADVTGTNVSTTDAENALIEYLDALDLGEDVIRDKLIQQIMNADENIEGIDNLDVILSKERITFDSTQDIYPLNKGVQMENDGITQVTGQSNNNNVTFTEDTDYQEIDNDGDTSDDAIDWSLAGTDPDDGSDFFVTYEIIEDIPVDQYEKGDSNSININVV